MPLFVLLFCCLPAVPAFGQRAAGPPPGAVEEEFRVWSDHPRLFLNSRRLRLLRRERERESLRWEQFHTLMAGGAPMPEPGFASALYYQAAGDKAHGRKAVEWALSPASADLRQQALVYDWCQDLLTPAQEKALAARLSRGIAEARRKPGVASVSARVLAAIALAGHAPGLPETELRGIVTQWWRGQTAPALRKNRAALPRESAYPLFEMLHALRDTLEMDLRENAPAYFKDLPYYRLLTYYPARYPAAENDYRIPYYPSAGEPDITTAVFSRAADLALVAYETNALETQFLQGWLIQDQFLLRGALGIPYEFLWANPYQPGLSYHHVPLFFHDPRSGILLVRSSWEENATWLGYFGGKMELYLEGRRSGLEPASITEPLSIGEVNILMGRSPMRFTVMQPDASRFFLLGLKPNCVYEVETDDEELAEAAADAGGILALSFTAGSPTGVRFQESKRRGCPAPPR